MHGGAADIPERMSWRVLKSVIKYSPRTSALVREMFGDEVSWSVTDHLVAGVYDMAAIIAWLNSDTKRNKRPKPIDRPGVKAKSDDKVLGTAVPVKDFQRLWEENIARTQQVESEAEKSPAGATTPPGDGQPE